MTARPWQDGMGSWNGLENPILPSRGLAGHGLEEVKEGTGTEDMGLGRRSITYRLIIIKEGFSSGG